MGVGAVVVKLHAWKGEKHLGAFEVGRINARGQSEQAPRGGFWAAAGTAGGY